MHKQDVQLFSNGGQSVFNLIIWKISNYLKIQYVRIKLKMYFFDIMTIKYIVADLSTKVSMPTS